MVRARRISCVDRFHCVTHAPHAEVVPAPPVPTPDAGKKRDRSSASSIAKGAAVSSKRAASRASADAPTVAQPPSVVAPVASETSKKQKRASADGSAAAAEPSRATGKRRPSNEPVAAVVDAPVPAIAAEAPAKRAVVQKKAEASVPPAGAGASDVKIVGHSGMKDDTLKQVERLRGLGVEVEGDTLVNAALLVTPGTVARTLKTLCAINLGLTIVRLDWVTECLKQRRVVDPTPYVVVDEVAEKKFGFRLAESLVQAKRTRVFADCVFALTEHTVPDPKQLQLIIESGGGRVVPLPARGGKLAPEVTVVSHANDLALCQKLVAEGRYAGHVYDVEHILLSVLRQRRDVAANILIASAKNAPQHESDEF